MKNFLVLLVVIFLSARSSAQQEEVAQLLLNVEKLAQFKQILADMQEGYEVLSTGYNVIKDLSEGNFKLHDVFLNSLLQVSPAVQQYFKVARIISLQRQVLTVSRSGLDGFRDSGLFSLDELTHFKRIADRVVEQSIEHIASLAAILSAGKFRMSDAERLSAIDALFDQVNEQLRFISGFNNSTGVLALQRLKEQKDLDEVKVLHGLK